jgi:hypothetical protein
VWIGGGDPGREAVGGVGENRGHDEHRRRCPQPRRDPGVPRPVAELRGEIGGGELRGGTDVAQGGRRADVLRGAEQVLANLAAVRDARVARDVVQALVKRPHHSLDTDAVTPGQPMGHLQGPLIGSLGVGLDSWALTISASVVHDAVPAASAA